MWCIIAFGWYIWQNDTVLEGKNSLAFVDAEVLDDGGVFNTLILSKGLPKK